MRKLLFWCFNICFFWIFFTPAAMAAPPHSLNINCDTCGFCAAPLGICILYYLIALLALLLLLIIVAVGTKQKCPVCKKKYPKGNSRCPKCNYDFDSGLQSTVYPIPVEKRADSVGDNICPRCGRNYDSKALFCGKCGLRLH
jgi:hypothetical protein